MHEKFHLQNAYLGTPKVLSIIPKKTKRKGKAGDQTVRKTKSMVLFNIILLNTISPTH